ncbi:MAG: SRPBCC family protein [Thermoleophilia bacterium]
MGRVDIATRLVAASPERVWAALVDPEALAEWLPPPGMSGRFERFDARPGGAYRLILTYADAADAPGKTTSDSDVVDVRFVEITPGARLVQAVDFVSDDPGFSGTMTMTWELTAADDGTRVEIRARDVPSGISPDDHAAGLASSLANLATYLAG